MAVAPRKFWFLLAACFLVVAAGVCAWLTRRPPESLPVVSALVARKNLEAFTRLSSPEDLFEVRELPRDSVPKEALTCFDDLRGAARSWGFRLNKPISEGSWVTRADLEDRYAPLPPPPGMEPATIHWEPHGVSGGFPLPGCHVDVHAFDDEGKNRRVILEDLPVLAVSRVSDSRLRYSLKLAVRPGDKEKLETADSRGNLVPLLRPLGD
jgi:Flp pilus assembly protein CpaB